MTRKEIIICNTLIAQCTWSLNEFKFLRGLVELQNNNEPVRGLSDLEKVKLYKLLYKYREQAPELYKQCKYDYRCQPTGIKDKIKRIIPKIKKPTPKGLKGHLI